MKIKYPRTPHLPWSKGCTSDDKKLKDTDCFLGKSVIVTEKMDGENTTMSREYIHARSLDSRDHPSRSYVKALHGSICFDIPEGYRICGENLYARHSISYENLKSYFYVFSIWSASNICLSWDETIEICEVLGLTPVPVIGRWYEFDEETIRNIEFDEFICEGYVLRNDKSFHYDDFASNVAKVVRENHVQTEDHWMHSKVTPNKLS